MGDWITWLIEGAGTLLRALFGAKAEPTTADLAARAATAETQLQEEQAANVVLQEGATARAAADARQLHGSGNEGSVNLDPAASVNTSPDAHFRD